MINEIWVGETKYYLNAPRRQVYLNLNTQAKLIPLTEFLDGIYGSRNWQVKSVYQHLPEDILDYSEKDRIDLLRGLWDSGGCDHKKLLYYQSFSPHFMAF